MKHNISIFSIFLILTMLLKVSLANNIEEKVIIYNKENYIPDDVLVDFTTETGISVEQLTYRNARSMAIKLKILKGRGYDVLISPTPLVEKMHQEGLLFSIDKQLVENFEHLDPHFLNKSFDPKNRYSVPYLWGSLGIAVSDDRLNILSWKNLWHHKWNNKLLLSGDMYTLFDIALKLNGYSINSAKEEEIAEAYQLLRKLILNAKLFAFKGAVDKFEKNNIVLGSLRIREVITLKEKNVMIKFIYPDEGAVFWMDSFVIPAKAEHIDNAHLFINYMLQPEIAARCVKKLNYATPNLVAKERLNDTIKNNPIIFPPSAELKKAVFQRNIEDKEVLYRIYWAKLIKERMAMQNKN